MKKFTDLAVWQESRNLVVQIYHHTRNFPREEVFGLTNRMRRASVSVASNIAEGFGRWSPKDKAHFYQQAHGSLTELKNQILISLDLEYLSKDQVEVLMKQSDTTYALLQGLMRAIRKKIIN